MLFLAYLGELVAAFVSRKLVWEVLLLRGVVGVDGAESVVCDSFFLGVLLERVEV